MTIQVDLRENCSERRVSPQRLFPWIRHHANWPKLSALELFREGTVSLGKAAERCGVPQAEFM